LTLLTNSMNKARNHILFWLAYLVFCWITDSTLEGGLYLPDYIIYILIHPVFIFYSCVFVISKFSTKSIKDTLVSVGLLALAMAVFLGLKLFYRIYITQWLHVPPYGKPFNFYRTVTNASIWFLQYFLWALGYSYARRLVKKEADLRKSQEEKYKLEQRALLLEQDNLKKEQAKLQAEYAFLRSQINPHFLHNTLNFFYSKSLHCSRELADGILTLSEIMRYSLHVGEDNGYMVPLSKEIEHMQHVIKINQLRFNNRLNIDFAIQGDVDTVSIIPFVLITLVENAFKHGELTDPACPLTLRLSLDNTTGLFVFSTYNRKKTGPRELSHGIGMDNIRKRLQWSYGNDNTLKIKDEAEFYTTELTIHSITKYSTAFMAPAEDAHYL